MPSHRGITPSHNLKSFPLSIANLLSVSYFFIMMCALKSMKTRDQNHRSSFFNSDTLTRCYRRLPPSQKG